MAYADYDYVRFALTQGEFARLLEILDDVADEPIVLKLRAKQLSLRAKRMKTPPTKSRKKT